MMLRHGISNELIEMVHGRLAEHRNYADLINYLGEGGIRKQLEKNIKWVVGVYEGDMCIAALWGNHEMNLVTRYGYENKWANPGLFRQFWKWYFENNSEAVVTPDNGLVIPFLLRIGFQWEDNKLVLRRSDLLVAAKHSEDGRA